MEEELRLLYVALTRARDVLVLPFRHGKAATALAPLAADAWLCPAFKKEDDVLQSTNARCPEKRGAPFCIAFFDVGSGIKFCPECGSATGSGGIWKTHLGQCAKPTSTSPPPATK
jgi:hypothetical protein